MTPSTDDIAPIIDALEDARPPREPCRQLEGKKADGYHFHELLEHGVGGFGAVYRATHGNIKAESTRKVRNLAIKVLGNFTDEDSEVYKRFVKEVMMLEEVATVKNVVRMRHPGIIEGMPFYVMDYVEGKPLNIWLAERRKQSQRPTKKQLIGTIAGILDVLTEIDEKIAKDTVDFTPSSSADLQQDKKKLMRKNWVHGDIKPSNIIIQEDNGILTPVLVDFGTARLFSEKLDPPSANVRTRPTETATSIAYTAGYHSPEMLLTPTKLDVRSDIFQVGLIAYEMMTGARYWQGDPFAEDSHKKKMARLSEAFSNGSIKWPRWLRNAVERSLSWDPDERFNNTRDFEQAIRRPVGHTLCWDPLGANLWRNALSLALVGVLISTAALWLWTLQEKSDDIVRLEREKKELKVQSTKDIEKLSDQKMRIVDQRKRNDDLIRQIKEGNPAIERQARLNEIRESYDRLVNQIEPVERADLLNLRKYCREFAEKYPEHERTDENERLRDWLDDALRNDAFITIEALKFTEDEIDLFESHTMSFQIEVSTPLGPKSIQPNPRAIVTKTPFKVDDVRELVDAKGVPKYGRTVQWDPKARFKITVWYGKDQARNSRSFFLQHPDILKLKQDGVLIDPPLHIKDDPNFKFYYRLKKSGFGAIPPRP